MDKDSKVKDIRHLARNVYSRIPDIQQSLNLWIHFYNTHVNDESLDIVMNRLIDLDKVVSAFLPNLPDGSENFHDSIFKNDH